MKLSNIVLASVFGVSSVTGLGVLAYRSSVHTQICLSYERQNDGNLDKWMNVGNQILQAQQAVKQNPFAAFAYFGPLMGLMGEMKQLTSNANDTMYAYKKTCPERVSSYLTRIAEKGERLQQISTQIHEN